jgi:pyrimidine oxygenase
MTQVAPSPYPPTADPDLRPLEHYRPRALPRLDGGVFLGLFLPNCSWSYWASTEPNGTEWTYEYNKRLVQDAERSGFAFVLPAARWRGIRGDVIDWRGVSLDTVTLAAGLLEATERIVVMATMHTNIYNPVVAAKVCADLDHMSGGRLGLNIVSGWNADEFESMGVPLMDHKERYKYTREWLGIVRALWSTGACTFTGDYFTIKDANCRPRPAQDPQPLIVNAGQSYTGMRFTAEEADYLFSRSDNTGKFAAIRADVGREVGFIATRRILFGETREQAEALADRIVAAHDLGAVRGMMVSSGAATPEKAAEYLSDPAHVRRAVLEDSIVGTPEQVAEDLAKWIIGSGVDGICLTLWDYAKDLEVFRSRVMPVLTELLPEGGRHLQLNQG